IESMEAEVEQLKKILREAAPSPPILDEVPHSSSPSPFQLDGPSDRNRFEPQARRSLDTVKGRRSSSVVALKSASSDGEEDDEGEAARSAPLTPHELADLDAIRNRLHRKMKEWRLRSLEKGISKEDKLHALTEARAFLLEEMEIPDPDHHLMDALREQDEMEGRPRHQRTKADEDRLVELKYQLWKKPDGLARRLVFYYHNINPYGNNDDLIESCLGEFHARLLLADEITREIHALDPHINHIWPPPPPSIPRRHPPHVGVQLPRHDRFLSPFRSSATMEEKRHELTQRDREETHRRLRGLSLEDEEEKDEKGKERAGRSRDAREMGSSTGHMSTKGRNRYYSQDEGEF
ncbi:hypothetical protein JCM8547_001486, partial [Rhodosporidiobolus lusitaniae]